VKNKRKEKSIIVRSRFAATTMIQSEPKKSDKLA
jgi:hypothetical protein